MTHVFFAASKERRSQKNALELYWWHIYKAMPMRVQKSSVIKQWIPESSWFKSITDVGPVHSYDPLTSDEWPNGDFRVKHALGA
jgi:hypothetical protein